MNVRILRDNSQSQAGIAEAAPSRTPQDAPNCSLLPLCLYLSYALFYSETKPSNSGQPRNADGSEPIMAPANDDSRLLRRLQSRKASLVYLTATRSSSEVSDPVPVALSPKRLSSVFRSTITGPGWSGSLIQPTGFASFFPKKSLPH